MNFSKWPFVLLVGDNDRSMRDAAGEFNRSYPDRLLIYLTTDFRISTLFNRLGQVNRHNERDNPEIDGQFLQYVGENSKTNLRQM